MIYTIIPVKMGWTGVIASRHGITRLILPRTSKAQALEETGGSTDACRDDAFFSQIARKLIRYFNGQRVIFDETLDLSGHSRFCLNVWHITREVPWGSTACYGEIARTMRNPRACRAVGRALGCNPVPIIIPCHRIIRSNGSPGGFNCGYEMKQKLLALEKSAPI